MLDFDLLLIYALSLPVEHRPQTTDIFSSVLFCRLHLPPAVLVSCCPHFFLRISFPSIPWSPSSSVALWCPLMQSSFLLITCPSQFHFLPQIWSSTCPWAVVSLLPKKKLAEGLFTHTKCSSWYLTNSGYQWRYTMKALRINEERQKLNIIH